MTYSLGFFLKESKLVVRPMQSSKVLKILMNKPYPKILGAMNAYEVQHTSKCTLGIGLNHHSFPWNFYTLIGTQTSSIDFLWTFFCLPSLASSYPILVECLTWPNLFTLHINSNWSFHYVSHTHMSKNELRAIIFHHKRLDFYQFWWTCGATLSFEWSIKGCSSAIHKRFILFKQSCSTQFHH